MSAASRIACRTWCLVLLSAGLSGTVTAQTQPAVKPATEHTVSGSPATVLGQDVHGADGKSLGRIIDVLVDQGGHPLAAVVDFGGFMGLGNRKIAVGWTNLKFDATSAEQSVTIDLTPDQLKAAPDYKAGGAQVTVVGAPPPAAAGVGPPPAPAVAPN